MPCWLALLTCLLLVGCGGATQAVRPATVQKKFCVYLPHRGAAAALDEGDGNQTATLAPEMHGVGSPAVPLTPPPPPPLQGLAGEGLGSGVPRGALRLVPQGGIATAEAGTGAVAGEALVTGGAALAAAGSVILVCLTVTAAVNGTETPIDIADKFYGTHFGDALGWLQGRYTARDTGPARAIEVHISINRAADGTVTVETCAPEPQADPAPTSRVAPTVWPDSRRGKEDKGKRGRLYVTYRKINKTTHRYYSGRTSMVVDLNAPLEVQANLAVRLRNMNHHIDENGEPRVVQSNPAQLDEFDVGTAIDYEQRYDDPAYWRIRGREQQMIDFHGGAQSDTGKPYRTENVVRAVSNDNPRGRRFHDAATTRWGQLHPYTGH